MIPRRDKYLNLQRDCVKRQLIIQRVGEERSLYKKIFITYSNVPIAPSSVSVVTVLHEISYGALRYKQTQGSSCTKLNCCTIYMYLVSTNRPKFHSQSFNIARTDQFKKSITSV
jgi:hypothetical protein